MKVITRKDLERIKNLGEEAFVNTRGCRNAVEAEHNAICAAIREHKGRKGDIKDCDLFVVSVQRNYGSRRWSDYRHVIDYIVPDKSKGETACYLYGIKKDRILAGVKK